MATSGEAYSLSSALQRQARFGQEKDTVGAAVCYPTLEEFFSSDLAQMVSATGQEIKVDTTGSEKKEVTEVHHLGAQFAVG